MKGRKFPVHDGRENVFDWIVRESHLLRLSLQQGNRNAAKAAKESQRLDRAKVANQKRQAIDAGSKGDGGKVSP